MTIKCVMVDFDGTLVDTFQANNHAYQKALKKHGFNINLKTIEKNINGLHWTDFLPKLLGKYYSNDLGLKIAQTKKNIYKSYFHKIKINHLLIDFLKSLSEDIKIVIVSNASKKSILDILEYFETINLFDLIVSADEVKKPKPFPDIYLYTLDLLNLMPNDCISIEDTVSGYNSSINAKIPSYLIKSFSGDSI